MLFLIIVACFSFINAQTPTINLQPTPEPTHNFDINYNTVQAVSLGLVVAVQVGIAALFLLIGVFLTNNYDEISKYI